MADLVFGDHVEADGRLVEEQQRRIVQQRGGDIAAHAFAEGELAHRGVQVVADVQDVIEVFHARVEIALGDVVDSPQQFEGFDDRDVPPQLGALAEDDADGFDVAATLRGRARNR